ncbi:YIP1 family protein [Nanoarchaeota archaeon]
MKKKSKSSTYLDKIHDILFQPKKFFNSVKKEVDYWPIIFFYVVIFAIAQVIETISALPSLMNLPSGEEKVISIVMLIVVLFFSIAFAFLVPFIYSGLIHAGVYIFGGRKGFFNTFKPITYAAIIGIIYSAISSIIIGVYSIFYPFQNLDANPFEIFTGSNLTFHLIIPLIIGLISFVHSLIVEVIGVSKFQSFTYSRALLAVIIIPLILTMIFFVALGTTILAMLLGFSNI